MPSLKSLKAFRYVRLTPFDLQTDQGRRDERYRLAALSILANALSKSLAIALMLLSVKLTLPYLGVERFGVWMTIASFAAILAFLDLGIGNALTNYVATRATEDNPKSLQQAISGGLGFLALISMAMSAILWLVAGHLPWQQILNFSDTHLTPEVRAAAMCFALLFGMSIFATGVTRVYFGLQKAHEAHIMSAFITSLACIALWYAAEARQGIVVLLIVVLGAQSLTGFALLVKLLLRKQFTLRGIFNSIQHDAGHLFRAGGLFFLLQIGAIIGWGADSLIIASSLGVAQVAIFSVVQRLFQVATQPLSMLNAPLWAAYADAHARGDKLFVKVTLVRSMLITFIATGLAALTLLIAHPWLIALWTNDMIVASFWFVALYAAWSVIEACGNAFAMFLNGSSIIKIQVISVSLFIALALPSKLYLVSTLGLIGIPIATIASYGISIFAVYGFWHRAEILKAMR